MSTPLTAAERKKIRIGDLLIENQLITDEQLQIALKEQRKIGRKLGQTLIALGYIEEDSLLGLLAKQLGIPLIDLRRLEVKPEIVNKIPETMARRYRALAIKEQNGKLIVGMADPTDLFAFDELVRILGREFSPAIVRESELLDVFDRFYRRTSEISNLAEELEQELSVADVDLANLLATASDEDVPVARLLKSIFEDAVQMHASDIHIEPDESVLRIRQRIDGVLHEQIMKEKSIAPAVVLRLKITAGLDISEKRLPQDGRFNIRVKNRNIDVRLSTMPVQWGESVVMRLLDQTAGMLEMERLGMPEKIQTDFRRIIRRPHGLILVTGPTGSGKTTTLYAALRELNKAEKKIVTAEDPVEYRLPRINQVQVKTQINLTFVNILRAALRQDPDVILIGEMRDQETVEIGLRAAMTGHLVLSTLHTNDAVHTADRLLDMGAEGFLIAASLQAIVAQRLVRRLCDSCAQPYQLTEQEKVWLESTCGVDGDTLKSKLAAGCQRCNHTGYRGRIGVYELLEPNHDMLSALRSGDSVAFAEAVHSNQNFRPMRFNALDYVRAGITSVEELMRISSERVEDDAALREPKVQVPEGTLDEVEN
ncbi:MAG: Flp pilus assembly complex ATPase component TadA [Gammaproteobacteria bacterium]|nr:Flp pilus assembly complex ATPase component TadA [Gammaproteobacteria bacterium]